MGFIVSVINGACLTICQSFLINCIQTKLLPHIAKLLIVCKTFKKITTDAFIGVCFICLLPVQKNFGCNGKLIFTQPLPLFWSQVCLKSFSTVFCHKHCVQRSGPFLWHPMGRLPRTYCTWCKAPNGTQRYQWLSSFYHRAAILAW